VSAHREEIVARIEQIIKQLRTRVGGSSDEGRQLA
jgi:hypothetical protein